MMILQSNQLSDEQTRQIKELERLCYAKDGLENHVFLSNEINYDREIPVFFLAYEGELLIGFLTLFIPTAEEAEISAIVHPAYQCRGVFTELDERARRVIRENGIGRTLYCVETKSGSASRVLKRWGIHEILRSEYRMKMDVCRGTPGESAAPQGAVFSAVRVTPDNAADYRKITNRAFSDESAEYVNTIMTSETRMGYVFFRNETPVGVFVIGLETEGEPCLYGVAVAESERGKGYGRLMMEQACKIGATHGKALYLDVDSGNPVAFHLYRSLGFEITFQVDYYLRRETAPAAPRG